MSSTNRGYNRHKTDYYVTPQKCIKEFLSEWLMDMKNDPNNNKLDIHGRPDRLLWLDPCAGGDEKHGMSYYDVLKEAFDPDVMTIDIREDSKAEVKEDYLLEEIIKPKPSVIITNPPFYLAKEIIEKALDDVAEDGYVIMLLRLNFLGSKARKEFFDKFMPKYIYVHNRRMSFTNDGKTDSIEYAHFVWQKNNYPEFSKLKIM